MAEEKTKEKKRTRIIQENEHAKGGIMKREREEYIKIEKLKEIKNPWSWASVGARSWQRG